MIRIVTLAVALAAVALAGCRGDTTPSDGAADQVCVADPDCTSPRLCVAIFGLTPHSGGPATCDSHGKICTRVCTSDPDCSELGAGSRCVASCDGNPSVCQ